MMNSVHMERDQWQMGKTKVFIKAPESVRKSYYCTSSHLSHYAYPHTYLYPSYSHHLFFYHPCYYSHFSLILISLFISNLFLSLFLSLFISIDPSINQSINQSIDPSIHQSIDLYLNVIFILTHFLISIPFFNLSILFPSLILLSLVLILTFVLIGPTSSHSHRLIFPRSHLQLYTTTPSHLAFSSLP